MTQMEEYLLKNSILSEETLKRALVEFNLYKEESSFAEFLFVNNFIAADQVGKLMELKLVGPEKIKIKFVRNAPCCEKAPERSPQVTESVVDTQTILVELFDKYEIIEVAGRGAMSWVYKVREKRSGEIRALKILKYAEFADDDQIKRFNREMKVVQSVQHPNIVKLHECGEVMGIPYYTMDYIEGSTLEEFLPKGQVPQAKILEIIEKVSRAIYTAHLAGVVHRDLKPSNIMIDNSMEPLLVDFGIAKVIGSDSSNLTQTGEALGTPAYMAPEQALGRFTDHRGDIFSLGTILYELLTGFNPFIGETAIATLSNVLTKDPGRPGKLSPSINAALESIIMKCLARDPAERYQSAGDLADDLNHFRMGKLRFVKNFGQGIRKWAGEFNRRHRYAVLLIIIVLLFGLAIPLVMEGGAELSLSLARGEMKAKHYGNAAKLYSIGLSVSKKKREQMLLERGICRRLSGEYAKALNDFEAIPESNRRLYYKSQMNKGHIYLLQGKYDRAIFYLTDALKANPDNKEAKSLLEKAQKRQGLSR